jgi:hypothetical protein
VFRAQRNLLITVSDRENFTCCDLRNGFAFAWVTEAAAGNTEYLRYHFIEAMTYNLLEPRYMVSLHAACVTLDGHGVLLAGNSGSGKSSLAYACARRGWIYNSDDSSALVKRGGGRTVICNPRSFRFRNTAAKLFPELRGLKARRRSNGKPTIEIPTGSLPNIRTAFGSQVDYIVFLNRGDRRSGPVQLLSVSKEEAMNRLYANPWPPELNTAPEARATVERLLEAETYEMRYRDLDSAVDRLQQIVRGGAQ